MHLVHKWSDDRAAKIWAKRRRLDPVCKYIVGRELDICRDASDRFAAFPSIPRNTICILNSQEKHWGQKAIAVALREDDAIHGQIELDSRVKSFLNIYEDEYL